MNSRFLSWLLLVGFWTFVGCHKFSTPDAIDGELSEPETSASPANLRPDSQPEEVVVAFLEAARSGDESIATQLLTRKAQEETEKEGLTLDLPGSPTMRYRIEKVEYDESIKDAAYVNSVWTNSADASTEGTIEVVWVLRRQPEGWRIAGMAEQVESGAPPVFMNFEEPDDVARLKVQLDDEPTHEPRGNVRQAIFEQTTDSTSSR
jgi:hypothetical protein